MENLKKKILFVLPFFPYPLSSGGSQAIFNGIAVACDNFEVFVTYRVYGQRNTKSEEKFATLLDGKVNLLPCVFPARKEVKPSVNQRISKLFYKVEKKLRKGAGIDWPTPQRIPHKAWIYEDLFPKETKFAKHVNDIVGKYGIDIVQCEMLPTVTLGLTLPDHVRKVFVHHELGWVVHELELLGQSGDSFEQKLYLDYYKTNEVALLNAFDDVIALSAVDSEKLVRAGVRVPVHTSLAVVNTSQKELLSTERGNVLSFVGPECNTPNVDGLKWFLLNVWGRLREVDPTYELHIIGKWKLSSIEALISGYDNVKYLGFVADLPSALKDTIMIVPITIGSGIRMKILEAASMGVPFVTTSVGVEGIPVENGVHCYVADAPEDFMNAVLQLKDAEIRKRFAVNANRLVSDRFTLDALRSNRLDIYNN